MAFHGAPHLVSGRIWAVFRVQGLGIGDRVKLWFCVDHGREEAEHGLLGSRG